MNQVIVKTSIHLQLFTQYYAKLPVPKAIEVANSYGVFGLQQPLF